MDHNDWPPHSPPPPSGLAKPGRSNVQNPYYLREIVESLLGDEAGAFDPERSCPYCVSEVDDAREVRLLRLDMGRLGHGDGLVLMCPGCGYREDE